MINPKNGGWLRILSFHIKLLIAGLALWFIYQEITGSSDSSEILAQLQLALTRPGFVLLAVIALLLVPLNWGLEAYKWNYLIQKIERLSFGRALRATLSGVTVSLFTPNRTGEFAGRVLYLDHSDRMQGALITVIGSIAQLLTTLVAGALGLLFASIWYQPQLLTLFEKVFAASPSPVTLLVITIVINLTFWLLVAGYVRTFRLSPILSRFRVLQKVRKYTGVFGLYRRRELAAVFIMSGFRYFVFLLQFQLLLMAFDPDFPLRDGLVLIPVIYLVMTVVPTITITELSVRGAVAVAVFGYLGHPQVPIIAATLTLWAINLALPALFGSAFVFGARIFRKTNPNHGN